PRRGCWGAARRIARIVFVVLGQRLQGSHRLRADHPRAHLAVGHEPRHRGRAGLAMRRLVTPAVVAGLALAPAFLPEFYVTLLNYIGLASVVALGLVLLTGVGGLTSFGQAAFFGIGAYTTAVLTTAYG